MSAEPASAPSGEALLAQWLTPEQILVGVEADSKLDLLRRMFEVAFDALPRVGVRLPNRDDVWALLAADEASKASGFGRGLAFPHVSCPHLTVPGLCIALPATPIDFGSLDGIPCEIVCLMLVPEGEPGRSLELLALLTKMSARREFRDLLHSERDPARICEYIQTHADAMDQPILARDVMRVPFIETFADSPLRDVTMKMLRHNLEAVAVLSPDREVLGQITCDEMLLLGLPDFFKQLKSVSFIRQFDPFEKYFEKQRTKTAGDVMSRHFSTLDESATLLEVVFELAVRRHPKVYVTREGRLVGVIDRFLLLDRVLNL